MAVRKFNPVTPGTRFRTAPMFETITKSKPEKSLVVSKSKSGGRNNSGRMTMRYIGGVTNRKSELLISNEINMECQPL